MKNTSLLTIVLFTLSMGFFLSFSTHNAEEEKGDLFLVEVEYVSPEHQDQYIAWGEEFKKLADKDKFKNFSVSSSAGTFYYVWNVGKNLSGLDEHREAFNKWRTVNPMVDKLYDKYSYTVDHRERELWRRDVKHSYRPADYKPSRDKTYNRLFNGYVKEGQSKAVSELLDEYAAAWKKHGISTPYSVYWNIFGTEQSCMLVISSYKDREAWIADRKEVFEKIGKEQLDAWDKRWNKVLRKMETKESFPKPNLSHYNEVATASTVEAND